MNVTASSLFHFTDELKTILNILKSDFKPSYCKEHFVVRNASTGSVYIPMVSFCDIPLGQIQSHIEKYGGYGIGMSKEWGIKKGLNPVMYLSNESKLAHNFSAEQLSNYMIKMSFLKKDIYENNREMLKTLSKDLITSNESNVYRMMYMKNYQYDLVRKGKITKDYRFYDEREWRFVPDLKDLGINFLFDEEDLKKGKFKKGLIEELNLNFNSEDIKYLIVQNDKDVSPLIRGIKKIGRLNETETKTDILISKIITVESLKNDFKCPTELARCKLNFSLT